MRRWLPLVIFLALSAALWKSLQPGYNPRVLPSALVGKPFPLASLPQLDAEAPVELQSLVGKPFVVNVFASWCPECVAENQVLIEFNRRSDVPVIGIAYKDEPSATRQWLARWGNPFDRVLVDQDGRFGIELGVYGAPESYFVDSKGVVRARYAGALSPEQLADFVDALR